MPCLCPQLSKALQLYPSCFEPRKINVVAKYVTDVRAPWQATASLCAHPDWHHDPRYVAHRPRTPVPWLQLDAIPKLYHHASIVYLSNNSLTTLQGLRQFTAVKVLSLANNKVCPPHRTALARCVTGAHSSRHLGACACRTGVPRSS